MVLEDAGIRADRPPAAVGDCLIGPGSIMDGTPYATTRDTGIERLPALLAGLLAASPPAEPRPRAGLGDGPGVGLRAPRRHVGRAARANGQQAEAGSVRKRQVTGTPTGGCHSRARMARRRCARTWRDPSGRSTWRMLREGDRRREAAPGSSPSPHPRRPLRSIDLCPAFAAEDVGEVADADRAPAQRVSVE